MQCNLWLPFRMMCHIYTLEGPFSWSFSRFQESQIPLPSRLPRLVVGLERNERFPGMEDSIWLLFIPVVFGRKAKTFSRHPPVYVEKDNLILICLLKVLSPLWSALLRHQFVSLVFVPMQASHFLCSSLSSF